MIGINLFAWIGYIKILIAFLSIVYILKYIYDKIMDEDNNVSIIKGFLFRLFIICILNIFLFNIGVTNTKINNYEKSTYDIEREANQVNELTDEEIEKISEENKSDILKRVENTEDAPSIEELLNN